MPERDWLLRLEDILVCTDKIVIYTGGQTMEQFAQNPMAIDAVLMNLAIIGEAATRIPENIRNELPEIPWESIRGMRNRLIHDYPNVDVGIVWQTAMDDLPKLSVAVRRSLAAMRREGD